MSDTALLDLDALLAPIEGGAGTDPRGSRDFQAMQISLDEARELEKQRDMPFRDPDSEDAQSSAAAAARLPAAWKRVRELSESILVKGGKDFEVAICLLEALVRQEGLAGLSAGTRLLHGLVERYWETGFPPADAEGLDLRGRWVSRLSGGGDETDPRTGPGGVLLAPLRRLPMFTGADGEPRALWQFTKRRDASLDVQAATEAARGDLGTFQDTGAAARDAAAAWAALEEALSTRLVGENSPSTRRVGQVLERIANLAQQVAGEPSSPPAGQAAPAATASGAAGTGTAPAGGLTRDDALRQLEQLAAFFRRTEPQSPLSYTLADAVRRARLPLPELLAEVMGDETSRGALLRSLGIKPPEPSE